MSGLITYPEAGYAAAIVRAGHCDQAIAPTARGIAAPVDPRTIYDLAQAALNNHATSSATGLCLTCRVAGPCTANNHAAKTFARYRWLPQRVPGLTRPELISARRVSGDHQMFAEVPR